VTTTTLIILIVVVLLVVAIAAFLINKRNKDAKIAQAEELRSRAASQAQTTIAPAQQDAAEAERRAEEARVQAERAEAEAREAQVAAQQVEAEHEAQVRDADRLDPRVDTKADDYSPQVPGTEDQQPTPPSEVNRTPDGTTETQQSAAPASEPTSTTETISDEQPAAAPGLPQRTRGAQEMPGQPIEKTDDGGGWFTRKDSSSDPDRA
jgi:FtsZ-interacting cell division protein ZipA